MATEHSHTVLVGHDGSHLAREALAWALRYATRTAARVRVMRGWSVSTAPRPASMRVGYVPPLEEFEAAVIEQLREDVAPVVAELGADVDITYEAHHGASANGLIDASHDADLLVVGARGLGGFRGLALGSVSDQCVRHSVCPVVVVRGQHSSDSERDRSLDRAIEGGQP